MESVRAAGAYYHSGNYNHISAQHITEHRETKLKVIKGESHLQNLTHHGRPVTYA